MQHMPAGLGYQTLAGRSHLKGKHNFPLKGVCLDIGKQKVKSTQRRKGAPKASKAALEVKMKGAAQMIMVMIRFQKLKMLKQSIGPERKKFYMESEERSIRYRKDVGKSLWTGLRDVLDRKLMKTRKTFRQSTRKDLSTKRANLSHKVDLQRRKSLLSSNLLLDGKLLSKGGGGNNKR
jgi:hypothetical protein